MGIRLNSRIARHFHQIATHDLTVWESWIIFGTFFRNFEVPIKNSQSINIFWSHFSALNFRQKLPSFVDSSYKGRTYIGLSITVLPTIFLYYCHQISHSHTSLCHNFSYLWKLSVGSVQSFVQSLSKNSINGEFP